MWDQGFWAPVYADWGFQNRTCGLRVSAPGRFEYRSVDSMHNPYLLGAALLESNVIMVFQIKMQPSANQSLEVCMKLKKLVRMLKNLPLSLRRSFR